MSQSLSSNRQTSRPLNLGFIGGGLSSAVGQVHFAATAMDGRWQLLSGAFSRNLESNLDTARQWGVAENRVYDNWRQFIAEEKLNLDAVAVLVPTPMHCEVVTALKDEGIPVICEKSLAMSMDEVTKIHSAHNRDDFLAVTFNYSGYPMLRELRSRISAGELGEIKQFHFEMPQEGFVRPPRIAGKAAPPQAWRLQNSFIPMVSHDLGIHLHHLAYFLLREEPTAVMADYSSYSPYHEIVDTVSMWLRYRSQMKGSFWFTKSALGHRNGMRLRIYGDNASAEWVQTNPEELLLNYRDGERRILDRGSDVQVASELRYNRMKPGHPAGFIEAFANVYSDFADALQGKINQSQFQLDDAYGILHAEYGVRLFDAASHSNNTGRWVEL